MSVCECVCVSVCVISVTALVEEAALCAELERAELERAELERAESTESDLLGSGMFVFARMCMCVCVKEHVFPDCVLTWVSMGSIPQTSRPEVTHS